ncbi:MAG TPA: PilZ domain-containing protein [Thermoanaerobaculia bacterium]
MYEAAARNLRTAERFLLAPPLAATFGDSPVAVCDISEKGARFRHDAPLQTGTKSLLRISVDKGASQLALEAVVVWSQPDPSTGRYVSGARTYGAPERVQGLLAQLQTSSRTSRIEELRSTDRFFLTPAIDGIFGERPVTIDNLSARGARIATTMQLELSTRLPLRFVAPNSDIDVHVTGQVVWTALKAISGSAVRTWQAGLFINEKPELLRLAIGHLCENNGAVLDTQSLRLKLKIMRARARQYAPSYREIESSGIPAEQFLLIQGVREELRLNPEEALHWYRRARITIADPGTRNIAQPIANHPDALAVWEYLDRTVDATIVGRAFELPLHD